MYVDADSCPVRIREIIAKAAGTRKVTAIFVAARKIPVPENAYVSHILVEPGDDAADDRIVELVAPGDLVITRDIPLAARLLESAGGDVGANEVAVRVINDRGREYSKENIGPRLSERNFMADLRAMGLESMRDRSFSNREVQAFSSTFDRVLTQLLMSRS